MHLLADNTDFCRTCRGVCGWRENGAFVECDMCAGTGHKAVRVGAHVRGLSMQGEINARDEARADDIAAQQYYDDHMGDIQNPNEMPMVEKEAWRALARQTTPLPFGPAEQAAHAALLAKIETLKSEAA